MNERQKALYEYLLEKGDTWTPQAQIGRDIPDYANGEAYVCPRDYHNTHERGVLTKDIRAINDSDEVEKIIISSSKGVKLANEEEFSRYISSQYASVFRRLSRVRRKHKKANLHNQLTLTGALVDAFVENMGITY